MRVLIIALSAIMAGAVEAGEPTALFAEDAALTISISAPWRSVTRAAPEDPAEAGVLEVGGDAMPIAINTRGKSRRDRNVCTFPPLRIDFPEKPPAGSPFHKQKKLKLVTYCKTSAKHQQLVLLEYAAYRLYNVATPISFRARLANVDYIDAQSGKSTITRQGFFIEDVDDLAARNDLREVERGKTLISMLDAEAAARASLFQFMIGNLDWDMTLGPDGEDCCHNGKIVGPSETADAGLTPAPYDFDMSGFVDAPYAVAPAQFRTASVRTRVYRGFCSHNAETRIVARDFLARRAEFVAALNAIPGLSAGSLKKATGYLQSFFDLVSTDEAVEKNIISKCRG